MLIRLKACHGDLKGALDESARAQKLTADSWPSLSRVVLLLQNGQEPEYRQLCHELLEQGLDGEIMAMLALLLPVNGTDLDRACHLADVAIAKKEPDEFSSPLILAKALAEYRRGHFDSANQWASRVSAGGVAKRYEVRAWLIQVLAQGRLGRFDEARTALSKAEELLNQPHVDFASVEYGGSLGDWTVAGILYREAKTLLETDTKSEPR